MEYLGLEIYNLGIQNLAAKNVSILLKDSVIPKLQALLIELIFRFIFQLSIHIKRIFKTVSHFLLLL